MEPGQRCETAAAAARSFRVGAAAAAAAADSHPTGLNPGLTFETFVVGAGNRSAHAAAQAVAEAPAASCNPLFIHGPNSLGKTHLLHAIGNDVSVRFPDRVVKCLTTERFLYDFVSMIQHETGDAFRHRYRQVDVLLIDDVGDLAGKPGVQEEFFHTFDHLLRCKTQLVLTSTGPPAAIPTLMERLTDRFVGGLIADLQDADLGTRLAILRQKAEATGVQPPAAVLELLAANVPGSIRELEGALTQVLAHHRLEGTPLTVATTQKILAEVLPT